MNSVDDLIAAAAAGARLKYLHFRGHQPEHDGRSGAGCLSQWWPAEFTVDGSASRPPSTEFAADPARWRGLNLLGSALIRVRDS